AQRQGDMDSIKVSMSAILAEANSADPWTSRARPSFLYVVYILLLFGLPMGLLSAFWPDQATQIALGFKAWLNAIPDSLYLLFGTVMTGYGISRTVEKVKGVA
ncbi:MAG TPA: 3TM-type holin, partial [Burkholderiaceae bacterium]|nr:3TM-type holin [Burkholderiaceae bacterium]